MAVIDLRNAQLIVSCDRVAVQSKGLVNGYHFEIPLDQVDNLIDILTDARTTARSLAPSPTWAPVLREDTAVRNGVVIQLDDLRATVGHTAP